MIKVANGIFVKESMSPEALTGMMGRGMAARGYTQTIGNEFLRGGNVPIKAHNQTLKTLDSIKLRARHRLMNNPAAGRAGDVMRKRDADLLTGTPYAV